VRYRLTDINSYPRPLNHESDTLPLGHQATHTRGRYQHLYYSVHAEADLGYDDVSHGFCDRVQLLGFGETQNFHVVLQVVLDAVVDVRNLADVVHVDVRPKVLDQFAPATLHQLPRLAVIQLHLCRTPTYDAVNADQIHLYQLNKLYFLGPRAQSRGH